MIKFRCSNCNGKIGVKDRHAGRQVKCPHCGDPAVVPSVEDAPEHIPDADSPPARAAAPAASPAAKPKATPRPAPVEEAPAIPSDDPFAALAAAAGGDEVSESTGLSGLERALHSGDDAGDSAVSQMYADDLADAAPPDDADTDDPLAAFDTSEDEPAFDMGSIEEETAHPAPTPVSAADVDEDIDDEPTDLDVFEGDAAAVPTSTSATTAASVSIPTAGGRSSRSAGVPTIQPPRYVALAIVGWVLVSLAGLIGAIAALCGVIAIFGMFASGSEEKEFESAMMAATSTIYLMVALQGVLLAVLFAAFGTAILAFRDIARHTFHLPEIADLLRTRG